ncbi:MAG: type II secretion system protein N [bacterium]
MTDMTRLDNFFVNLRNPKIVWGFSALLAGLALVLAIKLVIVLASENHLPEISIRLPETSSPRVFTLFNDGGNNQTVADLPEARINAEVLGLVAGGRDAYATIAVDGKKHAVYRAGDDINGSVKVESIDSAGVVVREQGIQRRIYINRLRGDQGGSLIQSASPAVQVDAESGVENMEFSVELGEISGLRIQSIDSRAAVVLGIREGDVVQAINDVDVLTMDVPETPAAFFNVLFEDQNAANIRIFRDGRQIDILVDASQVQSLQ